MIRRALVFIDETWAKTNMTRTHGRAARGQRWVAAVPRARSTTMTFLAALRRDRITAPCVFDGAIDGCLSWPAWSSSWHPPCGPATSSCSTTWAATKPAAAGRAIRDASARLLFLPPCSPGLNPIEMVLAKLNPLLRRADERSIAAVRHRMGSLLDQFSPPNAQTTCDMQDTADLIRLCSSSSRSPVQTGHR